MRVGDMEIDDAYLRRCDDGEHSGADHLEDGGADLCIADTYQHLHWPWLATSTTAELDHPLSGSDRSMEM